MTWMTFNLTHAGSSTTLSLVDGVNASFVSWAPAVAQRRKDMLAGRSVYADVIESITFNLFGSDSLANFEKLSWILDKADDDTEVVTATVQLQNSVLASALDVMVIGTGSQNFLNTPVTFNEHLLEYTIDGISISFIRKGVYLGAIDSKSVAAVAHPTVQTATMAEEVKVPSPTKVTLTYGNASIGYGDTDGFVVVSDFEPSKITILDANDMTINATYASKISESSKYAYGSGNVIRHEASPYVNEISYSSTGGSLIDNMTGIRDWLVLAAMRNGSTSMEWRATAYMNQWNNTVYSRDVFIGGSTNSPEIFNFGLISFPTGQDIRTLGIELVSASTSSSIYMYIDYFVFVPFGPNTQVIRINEQTALQFTNSPAGYLEFDPRALTNRTALASYKAGSVVVGMQAISSAFLETTGSSIATIFMMPRSNGDWRVNDASAAATFALDVSRYKGYLVPQ